MTRKGSLLFTFVILLAVSAILFSFVYVVIGRTKDVSSKKAETKAFFIAEAGINKAVWYISSASTTSAESASFGGGTYSFTITNLTGKKRIVSTGEVNGVKKAIQQDISTAGGSEEAHIDYAVYSNGTMTRTGSGKITGDVFSKGNISSTGTGIITGTVFLPTGVTYTKNGVTQPSTIVDPAPSTPSIETSYYDALLATAASQPAGNISLTGGGTYNLGGATLYVNGNFSIAGSKKIVGGGRIIVTGSFSSTGSGDIDPLTGDIGTGTEIIAGNNLTMTGSGKVLDGGLLFARNKVKLTGSGDITGNIIALNEVDATGSGRKIGFVYSAHGMTGSGSVVGAMVCKSGSSFTGSGDITYDPSKFNLASLRAHGLYNVIGSGTGAAGIIKGSWKEL